MFEVPDWTLPAVATSAPARKTSRSARKRARALKATDRPAPCVQPDRALKKAKVGKSAGTPKFETAVGPVKPVTIVDPAKPEKIIESAKTPRGMAGALQQLQGARFRSLNERLYVSNSGDALQYFGANPDEFVRYHEGFRQQTQAWPVNPVSIFIDRLRKTAAKAPRTVVADMGCGDAAIAAAFEKTPSVVVHSFDLVAASPAVTVASMTAVPLPDASVDVVIFCLSLMNTDYAEALVEARRILRPATGRLWIAEVVSRFGADGAALRAFRAGLEAAGFAVGECAAPNNFFVLVSARLRAESADTPLDMPSLRACVYKRR